MRLLALLCLLCLPLLGCPSVSDDDDSAGTPDDDDAADDDDSAGPCGIDAFAITQEVSNPAGVGTTFATTDALTFTGTVTNTCPFDVEFTTSSGCLFDSWDLVGSSTGMGMACITVITEWFVPQGGTLQQIDELGTLDADVWTWTVGFAGGQSASHTITVQ
jgi:hypothetical protein